MKVTPDGGRNTVDPFDDEKPPDALIAAFVPAYIIVSKALSVALELVKAKNNALVGNRVAPAVIHRGKWPRGNRVFTADETREMLHNLSHNPKFEDR